MNPNVLYTGLGCLLLGVLVIFRNERVRRQSVARPRRNPIFGPVAGKPVPKTPACGTNRFVCWMCCEARPTPPGLVAGSTHIVKCPECNIHSEITTVPLDDGEMYLGKMAVVNRVASYL